MIPDSPPPPSQPPQLQITLDELYIMVGELEITRRKQGQYIQALQNQIGEMSQEIERLNGRLVKTDNPE